MSDWNSEQYLKFKKDRTQPSIDLANRLDIENPKRILDIGCGPGNSTAVLKRRYPDAYVLGADFSPNMIKTAKADYNNIDFMLFDATKDFEKLNGKFDIVFSNACIQWVPNHKKLLKDMMNILNPKGIMAIQVPINFEEPIHRIITELVTSEKWSEYFTPRIFHTLTECEYFDILSELTEHFELWKTVYCHRMPSHQSIIEWYKSTGMKPYLDVLNANEQKQFIADVLDEIKKEYPIQANGEIIFRFPRLFMLAVKQ
ncbi:MAG: methyltransferase domain-containing protein [Eubacterium sp.]|nr:methyltransferase domain-containing protein [Eubacterium sp.]